MAVVHCLVPVSRPLLLLVQFLFYWGKHQSWFFGTFLHVLRVRVIFFWSDSTSGLNWWHLLYHSFAHSANTPWRCRNSFRIWEIRNVSLKSFSEEGKRVLTRIIWRSESWSLTFKGSIVWFSMRSIEPLMLDSRRGIQRIIQNIRLIDLLFQFCGISRT